MAEDSGFAQRLKELRRKVGLTQEGLAKLVNVSLLTVFRWENEERQPRLEEIQMLSKALNVSVSELLNGPSDGKVKLTLVYDWGQMKEGKIDMNANEFELILGSQGQIGLKGAGLITSADAIEEFLGRVKEQLTIALDAQKRRGAIPQE